MKEAHVGPASNFLPGLRKMCVMSIAKQKQVQESYLPYSSENQDQQELPFKNTVIGIWTRRLSLFAFLYRLPMCLC